jgi:hypothetical protein
MAHYICWRYIDVVHIPGTATRVVPMVTDPNSTAGEGEGQTGLKMTLSVTVVQLTG